MMSEEIGSMCVVLHRERSVQNVDVRVLKSAVQKYGRRAMFSPHGLWCLIELDLFSLLECQPTLYVNTTHSLTSKQIQMNCTRIRSNMINRLVAMMSEDVGPTTDRLPYEIHRLFVQWIEHRREEAGREILLRLYFHLANDRMPRIRLLSDLRTVYNLPEALTENKNLHRQLLDKFQMTEISDILYGSRSRGHTKESLCQQVIEHLEKKSELAFAFLSLLFQRQGELLVKQRLWPYLLQTSPFPDSTQALAYFYKTLKHKEHYLYLYHAMAFVIYEKKVKKLEPLVFEIDVAALYEKHRREKCPFELDGFVFDRHTGATTSRSEFALEGAQVANECQELLNPTYREMYKEFKILIDDDEGQKKRKVGRAEEDKETKKVKSAIDEEITRLGYSLEMESTSFVDEHLSPLAHGQRRTGSHKKAVFISSEHIYKGPYKAQLAGDRKKLLYNLYFTRAFLALEEHLKISAEHRSILDWQSVIKIVESDEYYLKQKSIGQLPSADDYELVTTKVESNVKVLRRGSHVSRLVEVEKDLTEFPHGRACLQHFYLRYLLNVGDSGTWNILLRRDETPGICGIDLEEIRSSKAKKISEPLSMLFSKISKQQRELYGPYLEQIVIFPAKIDLSDPLATEFSTSFQIDVQQLNERIEKFFRAMSKRNEK